VKDYNESQTNKRYPMTYLAFMTKLN